MKAKIMSPGFLCGPQLVLKALPREEVIFTPVPGDVSTVARSTQSPRVCTWKAGICLDASTLGRLLKPWLTYSEGALGATAVLFLSHLLIENKLIFLVQESPVLKRTSMLWGLKARGTVFFLLFKGFLAHQARAMCSSFTTLGPLATKGSQAPVGYRPVVTRWPQDNDPQWESCSTWSQGHPRGVSVGAGTALQACRGTLPLSFPRARGPSG